MTRVLCLAALAIGVAIGALGQAALSRPPGHESVQAVARTMPPVVACTASLTPADLAALRGELAKLLDERLSTSPRTQPASPHPDEPAPEAIAAVASANRIVDAALVQGTWKDADRQAFRTAISVMAPAQRGEAMSRLLTALNEGHLHAEVVGPVL